MVRRRGQEYRYSGITLRPMPLTPTLDMILARVEALTGERFNGVLLNLYRHGNDGMSWHSDDEPELGESPVIASISLGAPRRFVLRARHDSSVRLALDLNPGSLLLMEPPLQAHWQHAVPKTARACGARISLTWRLITARRQGPSR